MSTGSRCSCPCLASTPAVPELASRSGAPCSDRPSRYRQPFRAMARSPRRVSTTSRTPVASHVIPPSSRALRGHRIAGSSIRRTEGPQDLTALPIATSRRLFQLQRTRAFSASDRSAGNRWAASSFPLPLRSRRAQVESPRMFHGLLEYVLKRVPCAAKPQNRFNARTAPSR